MVKISKYSAAITKEKSIPDGGAISRGSKGERNCDGRRDGRWDGDRKRRREGGDRSGEDLRDRVGHHDGDESKDGSELGEHGERSERAERSAKGISGSK